MKPILPLCIALALLISACNNQPNEDQSKTVDKSGSVEVSLSTKHIDSLRDLLITHYTVWRHGVMVKQFSKTDTLPTLGKMMADDESNSWETIPRDYEFYVTVK